MPIAKQDSDASMGFKLATVLLEVRATFWPYAEDHYHYLQRQWFIYIVISSLGSPVEKL